MQEKHFTQKSFTFFTINYVIGVGFLTTIGSIAKFNYFGYLVIFIAATVVFGISLVFSRLSNSFKEHYGGSYTFAKHINTGQSLVFTNRIIESKAVRNFSFFVGWNQFIQTPILSAISPLFLASTLIGLLNPDSQHYQLYVWLIRAFALLFFIFLTFISTIGLKSSKNIIYYASLVKWFVLLLGLLILIYSISAHNDFSTNLIKFKENQAKTKSHLN
ncbi:amino acid permease [Mycoplasmopsis gallopavonis]|uniref:Amino acid permease n=1 Tax=Mycoplasmopsis gallopavonis TaxID=76629 RepID=A0A449AZ99_9BACT|nr:amino acid permease [Mycoplasmopsis gallopavonis]RIV16812.1 APC family permease [Mycoplasmopsis gallopavonis]VEU72822.1 Uncharacterised protein [Mycoplasmopsis gallopavonis]